LLLGGLEEKYRSLYLGTMDAIREHMLYRPMVPNNRDILFSGKVLKSGYDGPSTFEPEVTHLTCFLGGMVGMGAKVFGLEEHDLEIATKLSDGCVWAYESMETGIMPEVAEVYLCKKDTDCQWNETLWKEALDPIVEQREEQIKDYEIKKAMRKAEEEQAVLAEQARLKAEEKERNSEIESKVAGHDLAENEDATAVDVDSPPPVSTRNEEGNADPASKSKPAFQKRQLEKDASETGIGEMSLHSDDNIHDDKLQKKLQDTKIELQAAAPGRQIEKPSTYVPKVPAPSERGPDPMRPPTHKEYVESRIQQEGLAPGFTRISRNTYILR
jgi:mannosyl-oligosaccharide alpha-1,2-mannosidase